MYIYIYTVLLFYCGAMSTLGQKEALSTCLLCAVNPLRTSAGGHKELERSIEHYTYLSVAQSLLSTDVVSKLDSTITDILDPIMPSRVDFEPASSSASSTSCCSGRTLPRCY